MRGFSRLLFAATLAVGVAGYLASPSWAQFKGLSFSTPFPSQTVRAGEPVTLTLTIKNHGLPPQVVSLRVAEAPAGWKVTFLGGGRPVTAVAVAPDEETTVTVRLEPPAGARSGTFRFRLTAQGSTASATLPLALTLGAVQAARLDLSAELPVLRGPSTSSFRYRLTLKNESDRDLIVNLEAQLPSRAWQLTFTPSLASQQVTSLPLKAGESREIDAELSLPREVPARRYDLTVRAFSGEARAELKLGLEITGRPELTITTPEGRLSGRATAGRATPVKLVVKNEGSAPARTVELSSSEPTGWKVTFEPQRIDEIAVNKDAQVTATVVPSNNALAGDYMLTFRANAGETSSSADFRVTVATSTLWGIAGIVLVALALGVVSLAVSRYGRR